jgi:TPP-dependent pyruvate/acetoin dehydrogenase alpha subunit
MIDAEQRKKIEQDVEAEIEAAFLFAEESPFPNPAELFTDVFKEA